MFFSCCYRSIREYNLFDSQSTDQTIICQERWSTRLYIVVLSLAIIILLFYTTLHVTSNQFEFEHPSLNKTLDLFQIYPNLRCPCTKISTTYDRFLEIFTDFHPICSSVFVSNEWIEYLYQSDVTNFRYAADLRATLGHQFQVLRELCRLAIVAVDNGLRTLSTSELISGHLFSKDLFETKIQADIWAFQRMITEDFLRELTLVRSLIFGNLLMPAIPTAFTVIVRSDSPGVIRSTPGINTNFYRDINGSSCWCTDRSSCHIPAGFYHLERMDFTRGIFDQTIQPASEIFDQWFSGCWPMETLLLSKLKTFFNDILPSIDFNRTFLLAFNQSVDDEKPIEILVEKLFLRSFDHRLNYSSYFDQCHIESCFIDMNERASFLYIVTSLLGLYGGLSVALLFLVPTFVRLITKYFQREIHQPMRRRLINSSKMFLDLNLFKSLQRNSMIDQRNQRWSTRLYLICLSLALLFLTLYTSLTIETKMTVIKNPSFSTVDKLQRSNIPFECPCTSVSSTYSNLIEVTPEYHQICSSEFITDKWIEGLNRITSTAMESLYFADFRYSSPIFQLLKSICSLANQTIADSLFVFGQTQLITPNLLAPDLFEQQLKSSIDEFQRTTPVALLHLLQLTRNFTYMNQFLTGTLGSFYVHYSLVQQYIQPETFLETHGATQLFPNGTSTSCSCANDIQCGRNAAFYRGPSGRREVILTIPGFYSRCWPLESLLPSTLECFYDTNSCLDRMTQVTNQSLFVEIHRLNSSKSSRFRQNTTIEELLTNLFVESWSSKSFYSSYFSICQPMSCSHATSTRKNAVELLTTVTGLIGGLSVAFRLIIPRLVSLLMNLIERRQRNEPTIRLREKMFLFVKNFNVFERQHRLAVNEFELHRQRQSTRVYLLFLSIALFILMIYTSLTYQNNNYSVSISSLNDFRKLENLYLDCRCTQLSFNREQFYQVDAQFHPICSSDFVSRDWLNFLFNRFTNGNSSLLINAAFAHFQSLKLMCDLTRQAVIDARDLFLSTDVVVASMLNEDVFHQWSKATWNSFQSTFSQTFLHSFDMLIGMAQGNGLMSAYVTNWNLFLPNMSKDATIYAQSKIYRQCDCATSSFCIEKSIPELQGFVIGCLPIIAFLYSTFECFYNQSCLNTLFDSLNATQLIFRPRLLEKNSSRFDHSLLNKQITNEMFIESWTMNVSYEDFFNQCHPISCSYTLISSYNLLFVITTIVGLYGGLTVFLKILVPIFINGIHYLIERRPRAVAPQVSRF